MRRSDSLRKRAYVPMALAMALVVAACSDSGDDSSTPTTTTPTNAAPTAIYVNGNVVTMDSKGTTAQAMAVAGSTIVGIGTTEEIQKLAPAGTPSTDLKGATVLPGFIDPHSHMQGMSLYNDPANWLDVSGINVYFKPPPGDPRCTTPDDPQLCFIPVQNQDDVVARLQARLAQNVAANPSQPLPVLAFNYDASRMGHSANCENPVGLGFDCPNLENGHAREQLDAISAEVPIVVTAESGHFVYVNTPALKALNICGTDGENPDQPANQGQPGSKCYKPNINPTQETALANLGQLDEDLAQYAIPVFQNGVFQRNPGTGATLLQQVAETYAQHGYTLIQEGTASYPAMELYAKVAEGGAASTFPVSAAMLAYVATTGDFAATIDTGVKGRKLFEGNPLLTVAALKTFTDGSPQGYTAYFDSHYRRSFFPFADGGLFAQPYRGLPDIDEARLRARLVAAHKAGFPVVLHQIGDGAIQLAVNAKLATRNTPPPAGTRDVMLHIAFMTAEQLDAISQLDTAVLSVMPNNVYFFGLPECQQIIGPERTVNSYPAKSVIEKTGRVTLHTDSPVDPPYPLFAMWSAVTRNVQQPPWYPNRNPSECPPVAVDADSGLGDQRITMEQAVKGYTVDAAYQYGMENQRGTLEVGKIADMVLLSENPLGEETVKNPDNLKNIRVLGTVRYGTSFPNPDADQPPIWPA